MASKKKRIFGASRLRRKLKRMPDEINGEVKKVIAENAEAALFQMQKDAPRSDDLAPYDWEGKPREKLVQALRVSIAKDGLSARIGLFGQRVMKVFFFARFLEFGTRKMRKRPFIFPGWRQQRPKARAQVRNATAVALRRVAASRPSDE